LQRQHGIRGSRVRHEMVLASIKRLCKPAAGFALIALEPGDAALDGLVVGGHAGLAQDVDDEACTVSVTRRLFAIDWPGLPLPLGHRTQAPAAIFALEREQFLNGLLPIFLG